LASHGIKFEDIFYLFGRYVLIWGFFRTAFLIDKQSFPKKFIIKSLGISLVAFLLLIAGMEGQLPNGRFDVLTSIAILCGLSLLIGAPTSVVFSRLFLTTTFSTFSPREKVPKQSQ